MLFVTTTCYKWLKIINSPEAFAIICDSLNFLLKKFESHLFGYVIMLNHLHLILYFPKQNCLSDFMRDFKKYTSVKLKEIIENKDLLRQLEYNLGKQRYKI